MMKFLGPMERLNVDCIDMRSVPDGEYKWIVHGVDHLSKFHFAKALYRKVRLLLNEFSDSLSY